MSSENNGEELLRISDLHTHISVRDGVVRALNGIDLRVLRGQTLGIVGESGSGKTMTALSVMGLLPDGGQVVQGQILLGGRDLVKESKQDVRRLRGTRIGMIFQDPLTSLNPTMKIWKQVGEPLRIHQKVSKEDAFKRTVEILGRVGMPRPESVANSYPHQLSGGMRQRAMIAMALVCRPQLLIADEPTTALDVTTQRQILELIQDLRDEYNMGVILITHDLGVVAGHTDQVAVMYGGEIVETAPTVELFARPSHRYTQSLLAALPERALESGTTLFSIKGAPPSLREEVTGCRFAPRCLWASEQCRTQNPFLNGPLHHQVACFHPWQVGEQPHPGLLAAQSGHVPIGGVSAAQPGDKEKDTILDIKNVSKTYDAKSGTIIQRKIGVVSAVDRVSLRLEKGQTYGLVGESGCGKSTLGRLIAGLEPVSSGAIKVKGKDLATLRGLERKAIHANVQMMFQDSYAAMDPRMRIDEILSEPLLIQRAAAKADIGARIEEILEQMGLDAEVLDRYPHEFSGGQLQRIGFARSLVLGPDLIVADEPVSALDVSVQAQVLNLMKDMQQRLGLSYLFISHDLAVVQYMADRIGVMYLGRLVEEGPAAQVVHHPRHPYTRILIDAIPYPDPERKKPVNPSDEFGEPPSAINPPEGCRFKTRCPFATELCSTQPAWQGDQHRVACHFPLEKETPLPAAVR